MITSTHTEAWQVADASAVSGHGGGIGLGLLPGLLMRRLSAGPAEGPTWRSAGLRPCSALGVPVASALRGSGCEPEATAEAVVTAVAVQ